MLEITKERLIDNYKCFVCDSKFKPDLVWPWLPNEWEPGCTVFHFCCGCGAETNIRINQVSGEEFNFDSALIEEIKGYRIN